MQAKRLITTRHPLGRITFNNACLLTKKIPVRPSGLGLRFQVFTPLSISETLEIIGDVLVGRNRNLVEV